ncbi:lipoprotein signal peptidase [Cerasibacillus terrae]|uniref:Lipoprotein signal peptidase n=1 Tax=Cerasibacillus terrae TaxID=2498845 RepID=A0A5C8P2L9_9BACI|nr:signal peptidase II [Cerasibacillus terrae]TXL67612.1 lipoprotein signal peptidase [Cerasibacillus terrae]
MYWYYLIALIVIGIDQLSKWIIVKNMEIYEQIPVIDGFFYITSHRNRGAAWGILQDQMIFFYIITVIVIIGIVYFLHKYGKDSILMSVSLSLILGGAIGNFIDRLLHKEVIDFLDFIIFTYDYPIFNIADSALVIGVILLMIVTFKEEKRKETK